MQFTYLKSELKGTFVPSVVFDCLTDARSNDLKVILYIIKTGCCDPLKISADLDISHSAAVSSMLYWTDKGLMYCQEESERKHRRKPAITSEVVATMSSDPGVQALSKNLQLIFGSSLSERHTNQFMSLYLEDCIPVDVILPLAQHNVTRTGVDNPAYIIKIIRSWQKKHKFTNGSDVDVFLALLAEREKVYAKVGEIFTISPDKLTTSEKTVIDRWKEKYNMSFEMIEESFERAGEKADIKYCDGMLKSWSRKGYKTPKDLADEITHITQSRRNIDSQDDFVARARKNIPTIDD
ncbi:MAG: DnaD domain protein [Oscillospiraceae bacterium]|nr:DnaD domain protein [Oscillospiraceae bacterium]